MSMLKDPSIKYRPFPRVELANRQWPDRIIDTPPRWCSTDLRDGNQALIEPMDIQRKLQLFEVLVGIGFKEIEIGFPSASQTEFDFVRRLIEDDLIPDDVTVQVLTQAREELVDRTFDALDGIDRAIVHLYHATSPIMRERVFRMSENEVVTSMALRHVERIKAHCDARAQTRWGFQYSPEMFSGTELHFSKRIVDAVTETWMPSADRPCIINLPSTVEHSTPNLFADMMEWMHRHLERRDQITLSVHPHNDRGTGTAAAELAVMAGAQRVEGCLFGNGERTGNVDLVMLAMNLYSQGVHPGLDFSAIDAIRAVVEHCNQIPVHPRHPYAGELVYTAFSGSHQDAIRKILPEQRADTLWEVPYLPIDPRDVGRSYEAVIRVNSQSGKGGMAYLLRAEYGFELPRRLQIDLAHAVQRVSDDTGKELSAQDIHDVFAREFLNISAPMELIAHTVTHSTSDDVAVRLVLDGERGRQTVNGEGHGIDAALNAVARELGADVTLESLVAQRLDVGNACYASVRIDGRSRLGAGRADNADAAAVRAFVCALNLARIATAQPMSHAAA